MGKFEMPRYEVLVFDTVENVAHKHYITEEQRDKLLKSPAAARQILRIAFDGIETKVQENKKNERPV